MSVRASAAAGSATGSIEPTEVDPSIRVGLVAVVLAAALYASTVIRGLGWDDAAELSAGMINLGVVHQTGYPLYLLLGKLFTVLLPFVPDITATNLFSAAAAAGCVGLVARFTVLRTGSVLAGAVAATLLATGSLFWTHARVASVYPLSLCWLAALLVSLALWEARPTAARLAAVAFAAGSVVISHRTGIVFAVAVLLRLVLVERAHLRPSRPLLAAFATCAPLLTLLYFPARVGEASFPDALASGETPTWRLATGSIAAPDAEVLSMGAREVLRNIAEVAALGASQLSVASLLLGPLGLWALRRDGLLLSCGVAPALLISGAAATTYGNYGYWHFALLLVGAVLTGAGVAWLAAALVRTGPWVRVAAVPVVAVALATSTAAGVGYARSESLDATAWARSTLEQLPDGASVEGGWTGYTVLAATQSLQGVRPDVEITEGQYWLAAEELEDTSAPLLAAVSFTELTSSCAVLLRPLGPAAPTNFKGLTHLSFAGVQLGYEPTLAQLISLEPSGRSGCPVPDAAQDP